MEQLFRLDVNGIELALRTALVYFVLLLVLRRGGHRQMGSFELPDLLLVVLITDGLEGAMAKDYESVTGGVIIAGTLILLNLLLDWLVYRFPPVRSLLVPDPLPLVEDGRRLRNNMKREFITDDELDSHLRAHGIEDPAHARSVQLEPDGQLSVFTFQKQGDEPPRRRHA